MKSLILIHVLFNAAANAQSSCNRVSFVDRKGWNAREPTSITNLAGKPLSFDVIHHTYQPPKTSSPNEKALEATRLWIDCGIERDHATEAYYIITHRQL
ncbi:unnamed protein product [Rotaria sp. Silwood2]|nr:unnamed protein product [Rotaria sp. Silwood2]CAF2950887.1 unnamed protein product [Rotaria sp. Silwood2]CAF4599009.1 unnamed protein product [Rotaria sp. Silwood2]CAF4684313.1 unnamed protein product [Rotaria sp. Silwood2]